MRKFKFQLETLLRFRSLIEDQKKKAFAEVQTEINNLVEKRDEVIESMESAREELISSQQISLNVTKVIQFRRYIGAMDQARQKYEREIELQKKKLEARRLELVQAHRAVVERTRQPVAVPHQRQLAAMVALVLGVELRNQKMRLVEEHDHAGREKGQQVVGWCPPSIAQ